MRNGQFTVALIGALFLFSACGPDESLSSSSTQAELIRRRANRPEVPPTSYNKLNSPCAGIVCPSVIFAPRCEGDALSYDFQPNGVCYAGECLYPHLVTTCPNGCENGACLPAADADPCADMICPAMIQPPRCDGDLLLSQIVYDGTCNEGKCQFKSLAYKCPNGCENAACSPDPAVDPCAEVKCPSIIYAPSCEGDALSREL